MNVEINYAGVLLAAIASMAVGAVWYAEPVFGKMWMKLVGLKKSDAQEGAVAAMAQAFVAALLTAYVLAHVTYLSSSFFATTYKSAALTTAFWLALGISATTLITHYAFEGRRKMLVLLNVAHQFASFLVMGVVLGLLAP
jgi:hypothetical protein